MRSEENYRRMNNLNALSYRFFVWITACHGRVHEKWPKDTEETWIPTEEQRKQAKAGLKPCFGRWSGQIGTNRLFWVIGRDVGFGLQIGTVPARTGRLASMVVSETKAKGQASDRRWPPKQPKNAQVRQQKLGHPAVITRDARRAFAARSASRDRQPRDDVIFVGDDASHEPGAYVRF